MPKLYLNEYKRSLSGRTIFIACREGILRDFFFEIISDIKFLDRQNINTVLFHNISNRFANQKIFRDLANRLCNTEIIRIPHNINFYDFVLNSRKKFFKIIFLERSFLVDKRGKKINSLTTSLVLKKISNYGDAISNVNLKDAMKLICNKIENKCVERVHIIPAGKNKIKHELFSIEGCGTLIANNFIELFSKPSCEEELKIIYNILKKYRREGFLKLRSLDYVKKNKINYFVVKIDDVIVACAEMIPVDSATAELGSLAVSTKYRKQQVGIFLVNSFLEEMKKLNMELVICLTNNPGLKNLLQSFGFRANSPSNLKKRQKASPKTKMFVKKI